MTKDRARKQAARDRAAATGERYVVARRQAVEDSTPSLGRLHDLTHQVPGVPSHVEGGLQGRTRRVRVTKPGIQNPTHTQPNHVQPQHGEPRVLVGWQNRIARLFSAK